ncbi:MAG: hypothetical protein LBG93_04355 [Treponema sp.]|jgi:osmoprotectant transport system permease protein|nr:hypothetical protein [Treponema sp.]
MKRKGIIAAILAVLVIALVMSGCRRRDENVIVIGAADYTEQFILGYVLQILIDENTDFNTRLVSNLSTTVLYTAFITGNVDLYIEYTGNVYGGFWGFTEILTPDEVFDIVRDGMRERYNARVLDRIGFNNTYAIAVRPDTAAQFNLRTITDLTQVSDGLILGATIEFINREDGLPNMERVYEISFANVIPLMGVLRYTALMNDEVQVISAFSTDGMIMAHDLVVLEDDRQLFPPYHAAVVIREEIIERFPGLVEVLSRLIDVLDDDSMRALNYRVDVLHQSPAVVARSFLAEAGLIP